MALAAVGAIGTGSACDLLQQQLPQLVDASSASLPPCRFHCCFARTDRCRELHSAVRRAYLGPEIEELESGCLPDAFEADERAEGTCPDLLQIVSGRQLLGAVRERRLELLARQAAAAAVLREGHGRQHGEQADAALPGTDAPEATKMSRQQQQLLLLQQEHAGMQRDGQPPPDCMHAGGSQEQQPSQSESCRQGKRQGQQRQRQQQRPRDPDILDLMLGEDLVASAVRHFPLHGGSGSGGQQAGEAAVPAGSGSSISGGGGSEAAGSAQPLPAEVIGVYGSSGELLARVEAQQLDPGSATASSARLLNAAGRHTHTVYRTQTPLVR